MKSKKIVSSKFWLIFGIILIAAFVAMIPVEIQSVVAQFATPYDIVMFGACLVMDLMIAVGLFVINRAAALVWYEKGTLKRRGLFFGYRKEVKLADIEKIEIASFSRDATYFVFNDKCHDDKNERSFRHGNEHIKKDSFICIEKTDKNRQFIRSFWNGRIGNYIEKENDPWA